MSAYLSLHVPNLTHNTKIFIEKVSPAKCAAMLKCDAFGFGFSTSGPAIYRGGCRTFYVTTPAEALALRDHIPLDAKIYMLLPKNSMSTLSHFAKNLNIWPVANTLESAEEIVATCPEHLVLRVDLDTNTIGVPEKDLLKNTHIWGKAQHLKILLHSAHANDHQHTTHLEHITNINRIKKMLNRPVEVSYASTALACSNNIDFLCDEVRIGVGLWGIAQTDNSPETKSMQERLKLAFSLSATIIKRTYIEQDTSLGYGHNPVSKKTTVGTLDAGYMNGLPFKRLSQPLAIMFGKYPLYILQEGCSSYLTTVDLGDAPIQVGAEIPIIQSFECTKHILSATDMWHTELLFHISHAEHVIDHSKS